MYDIPRNATSRGLRLTAAYSFGSRPSTGISRFAGATPGPGTYTLAPAIGAVQPSSQLRSQPSAGFGRPPPRGGARGGVAGLDSPGPIYSLGNDACGTQHLSESRSLPNYAFPRSKRFDSPAAQPMGADSPGPGAYVV
eukprot:scaffold7257_cov125-Isochrysis_galbana.AAC.3